MRGFVTMMCATLALAAGAGAEVTPPGATRTVQSGQQALDKTIKDSLDVSAYSLQELALPAEGGAGFDVVVNLGGVNYGIVYTPHSIRSADFQVLIDDGTGLKAVPAPQETSFRGFVDAPIGGNSSATLYKGQLNAMVWVGGVNGTVWNIQPLTDVIPGAKKSTYVVYSAADSVMPEGLHCGVPDNFRPNLFQLQQMEPPDEGGVAAFLQCEVGCDADFEFYQKNGSSQQNTINDVTNVMNNVSNVYELECNVEMIITTIIVRTSEPDPYSSTDPGTLLNQFAAHWQNQQGGIVRDIAHLFTGKNINGGVIGIAWLSAVCSKSIGYGLSESRFSLQTNLRTGLTAHEIGHNFSANHCDGQNPCKIMCSAINSCNGLGNPPVFGAVSAPVITNYAKTKNCLTSQPKVLDLPFFDPFGAAQFDPEMWPVLSGAIISSGGVNERSAPASANLDGTDYLESGPMNTSKPATSVFVSFWTEAIGVENGEKLNVKYWVPGNNAFSLLTSITSDGINDGRFTYNEFKLPANGISVDKSKIRFEAAGNDGTDDWYIDDVEVDIYCRADVNLDHALDVDDFITFQIAFGTGDALIADYNDDGLIDIDDFIAYQTAYGVGCY